MDGRTLVINQFHKCWCHSIINIHLQQSPDEPSPPPPQVLDAVIKVQIMELKFSNFFTSTDMNSFKLHLQIPTQQKLISHLNIQVQRNKSLRLSFDRLCLTLTDLCPSQKTTGSLKMGLLTTGHLLHSVYKEKGKFKLCNLIWELHTALSKILHDKIPNLFPPFPGRYQIEEKQVR